MVSNPYEGARNGAPSALLRKERAICMGYLCNCRRTSPMLQLIHTAGSAVRGRIELVVEATQLVDQLVDLTAGPVRQVVGEEGAALTAAAGGGLAAERGDLQQMRSAVVGIREPLDEPESLQLGQEPTGRGLVQLEHLHQLRGTGGRLGVVAEPLEHPEAHRIQGRMDRGGRLPGDQA